MRKELLRQYKRIKEEIKDLNRRIKAIEDNPHETAMDKVRGSSKEFPYCSRSFTIVGIGESEEEHQEKLKLKDRLLKQKVYLMETIDKIEHEIESIEDSETRQIWRYYIFDGLTQTEIAERMYMAQSVVSERLKELTRDKVS